MGANTKTIKTRISSVKNIKKITKAMELVSAAKMKRAVDHALNTRSYAELSLELLINISKEKNLDHPLLAQRKKDKVLCLVIASNKGLCGGFNSNISKLVYNFIKENSDKQKIDFITVGKKAEHIVKKTKQKVIASFIDFPDNIHLDDISGLTKIIIDEFSAGSYDRVVMIYTNFISSIKNEALEQKLLPISEKCVKKMISQLGKGGIEESDMRLKNMALYLFEPSQESILSEVLPRLTEVQIYQALLESSASEHSARMMAMKNAGDSATDMIDELSLSFNQARQAAITQEIAEIVGGSIALNN